MCSQRALAAFLLLAAAAQTVAKPQVFGKRRLVRGKPAAKAKKVAEIAAQNLTPVVVVRFDNKSKRKLSFFIDIVVDTVTLVDRIIEVRFPSLFPPLSLSFTSTFLAFCPDFRRRTAAQTTPMELPGDAIQQVIFLMYK